MMNDEQLIELIRKIKNHCDNEKGCKKCIFNTQNFCQIKKLIKELDCPACIWDMKEIERIIKK